MFFPYTYNAYKRLYFIIYLIKTQKSMGIILFLFLSQCVYLSYIFYFLSYILFSFILIFTRIKKFIVFRNLSYERNISEVL